MKIPVPGIVNYLRVNGQGGAMIPKRTKAIGIAPGCLPEINGMSLLQKTTHFSSTINRQAGTDLNTSSLVG